MTADIRLSKNFALSEFLRSDAAARHGIDMTPSPAIINELEKLCTLILQPLRDAMGPVVITSGYRPAALNLLIGGSTHSQHCKGQAADITMPGASVLEVCQWLSKNTPFDQCIHEFGQWCHVSASPDYRSPRRQLLTASRTPHGVRYDRGLPSA